MVHRAGLGHGSGFQIDRLVDWARPVDRSCLWCHASRAKPILGTRNGFADPPFTDSGVSCERCHSDASAHMRRPPGAVVNPAKLAAEPRADVCRQCHQKEVTRADRPGRSFYEYKPGMRLADLVSYSLGPQSEGMDLTTTRHFERLAESKCQKSSGEKLWCGSCHSPHGVAARVGDGCAQCHTAAGCGRGPQCANCHMPKARAPDANHGVFTDHWIRIVKR